jgi:hypothetical protein
LWQTEANKRRRSPNLAENSVLPYRIVLAVASLGLGVRYLFDPDAEVLGRVILAVVLLGSFLAPASPVGQAVAIVAQLTVCLFVLFRLKINA